MGNIPFRHTMIADASSIVATNGRAAAGRDADTWEADGRATKG